MQLLKSEKQWKEIWNEALMFADDHDIEISRLPRKRRHKLPAKLCDAALVTTTVGHREELKLRINTALQSIIVYLIA